MITIFIAVLNMSLVASFVALGVILIRILLKKAPRVFSYVLWAIVLFKLLCPLTIETAMALIPVKAEPVPIDIIYSQTPSIDSGIVFVDNSINQVLTKTAPTATTVISTNPVTATNSIQSILLVFSYIWITGIVVLFIYTLVSYFCLKYRLRLAIPTQKNIYESDRIKTAFVLGFVRPKVYLPVRLSEQEIDYILKHEQTHIKRLDYLIKPLAFITVCIHWFNPIVWVSYFMAMGDMELSCDESVLKNYGSDIRKDYSNSLLSLSVKQHGLISPLAFGETGVKDRIKNVLKYKRPTILVSIIAIIVIIVATVLFLPNAKQGTKNISPITTTENITLEYSDESGFYSENYIKKTAGDLVTLFTMDNKEIISGKDVIPLPYVYAVKAADKYDLIDKKTYEKVSSISYNEVFCQKYPDGRLSTTIMKGRVGKYWGLISAYGKPLTNPQTQAFEDIQLNTYEEVWPIIEVLEDGKFGALDYKGKMVIKAEWEYLGMDVYNVPNTVFVCKGGKWGGIKLKDSLEALPVNYSLSPPKWIVEDYKRTLLSQSVVSTEQLKNMFDFASKYRFDCVPFFTEGNAPQSSSKYIYYAFVINMDNWGDDKGKMSKEYVENVIKKHFELKDIVHEGIRNEWEFDGSSYIAVPRGINDEPIYVLSDIKSSVRDGKTVYIATMNQCNSLDGRLESDEAIAKIRTEIVNGDYSSLGIIKKETFTYYLNDRGEPVFIAHNMTDRPEMQWFYQMFKNDTSFKVLGSKSGEITDDQMATYAVGKLSDYSYEKGNSKEEYNVITQKYFGSNIKNFNNGATEIIKGTDKIRATGWSYDNNMYVIVKDVWYNSDGSTTGDFYCINISDSYWSDKEGEYEEVERAILNGEISPFPGCDISIKRVTFEVEEEKGKQYLKYYSVIDLHENLQSIELYSK